MLWTAFRLENWDKEYRLQKKSTSTEENSEGCSRAKAGIEYGWFDRKLCKQVSCLNLI